MDHFETLRTARNQAETLSAKVVLTAQQHWKPGYKCFQVSLNGTVIGTVEQMDHSIHKKSGRLIVKTTTKVEWVNTVVGVRESDLFFSSRKKAIVELLVSAILADKVGVL